MPPLASGFFASLFAGLSTSLGALPVLLPFDPSERTQGILLGIGGGMMLAATSFSLILPGTEAAIALGYSGPVAALVMVTSVLLGGAFLWAAHNIFPHEHFFKGPEGPEAQNIKRIWLFVIAIALHNFPEGLAVGVGFGGDEQAGAIALALGIALQNLPEGFVVAVALRDIGYASRKAFAVSSLTGLIEPIGGLFGAAVVTMAQAALPWAMGFAAGAMLFVIVDEIIPDIDQKSFGQRGTLGLMGGFVIMMFLDIAL
ncbi:ZIP family metal transporter [Nodosilinea sp. PGN35]|uniref:ZIP family metal transporter n=1 Tax=Nodosilinea sp. PGN35 TaxID=3020489 RepID=UPI0023B269BC|nr:ZIP family metal transporter [Nodosilinea sp. TSF1-S3]MDF0368120.1 ZIP family metal transporter [Nodosilinea sp. TSF1-S3]